MTPLVDKNLLLSVITVVRNDTERLAATIDSFTGFYSDDRFEHIVIDGKSDDQTTLDLIWEGKKHKNYRFLSEADSGIYDAMNKGVRLASGRFLLFLNCGDRMAASPGQLAAWVHMLSQAPGIDVACFSCRVNQGNHQSLLLPLPATRHKMPTSHQAMLFSKDFMQAHAYDTRYRIAADFNLYLSARPGQILQVGGHEPVTDIEAVGVASESPLQSYKEYLQIAYRKLRGPDRWQVLARIGCKGVAVVFLKKVFPRTWVHGLRRLM